MQTGRVIEVQRVHLTVALPTQTVLATVRGDFHASGDYPKVGDWVKVSLIDSEQAVIEAVLPRTSTIERLDQETLQPQILVTNVDLIIIVMGLDGDYNLSRLERYLALASQSQIKSLIVLNKADVSSDLTAQLQQVIDIADDSPVLTTTATTGDGLDAIKTHLTVDTTAVLLGSSGAGKSTITNWLLGSDQQDVNDVRETDSRGRHTTTTRQLFTLPDGGYLIDTPGMRELSLAENEADAADQLMTQIELFATQCQFSNCDHEKSDGCAVLTAIDAGELEPRALDNYHKLLREQAWLADKSGSKERYTQQANKRSAQATAAATRRRLSGGR